MSWPACDCSQPDDVHTDECAWWQYALDVEDSEIDAYLEMTGKASIWDGDDA